VCEATEETTCPLLGSIPHQCRVPHIPDFLCSFVGSLHFMRLSLKKGAHAVLSRAAYRKFGASRSFFARCGIPPPSPSSLSRSPQLYTGAPCSHQRTWAENDGRSPPRLFASDSPAWETLDPELPFISVASSQPLGRVCDPNSVYLE
jgi:hypothetical protein